MAHYYLLFKICKINSPHWFTMYRMSQKRNGRVACTAVKSIGLGNLVRELIDPSGPGPDQDRILDLSVLDRERRGRTREHATIPFPF